MPDHAPHDHAAAAAGNWWDLFEVYVPRRQCMYHEPDVIWLHFTSDLLIAAAYFSIPLALLHFVRRRTDLAFNWMFLLFALFIILCGTTHLFGVVALWRPYYRLDGYVKLLTGLASAATAGLLWRLMPRALALPSAEQFRRANERLEAEVRERKQAEEEVRRLNAELERRVRERTAELESLLDNAPVGLASFDRDGRYLRVNRTLAEAHGVPVGAHLGRTLAEVVPAKARVIDPVVRRVFETGLPVAGLEVSGETSPGEVRHWLTNYYPVPAGDGGPAAVGAVVLDITDRKRAEAAVRESEARFRQLAESIPQLAWTATPSGDIDWYNRRWYEYTGTTLEQMRGWGWQAVHDPAVLPQVLERWRGSIATGEPFDMVFPLKGADGRFRPFLTRVMPLRDDGGSILHWFGTNTDISEIKEKEDALREADRRKDEFLAMLAHELRNPLAPIRNGVEILRLSGACAGGAAGRVVEIMDKQLHHVTRLVDDLLDVSRITRGRIELRKERVDLADVAARAVEAVRPLAEARQHHLSVLLPPHPVHVDADPTRLEQVFVNLLNNAVMYTNPGGQISLAAGQDDGVATVRVRDTGSGIAPHLLPHVFDLFAQGERPLARSEGGLGIGLSLVKKLIEMHDGSVEAHSAGPGRGSEFVVRLPALAIPAAETGPTEAEGPRDGRGLRVLVVEDMPDVADTLVMLLQAWGHEPRVAYDGPTGVVAFRTYRPDVVLCDIGLPGMSGYEVAGAIRREAQARRPLLVAVTGYGAEEDRRRAHEAGFDLHLTKPPDPAALEKLLAGHAAATGR